MKTDDIHDSPPVEEWNKTYSHPSGKTGGHCIQLTPDGGYVVVGYAGGGAWYSFYLLKVDNQGNEQWNRTFGSGYIEANWVEVTSDNGYIITGRTCQWTGEEYDEDVWLIKTDVNGNEEWNKTFGGTYSQWGNCVKQIMDDGYIVAGRNLYNTSLLLIKTDALGNELWTKYYGNQSSGNSLALTTDGKYIITGSGNYGLLLMKVYQNGTIEWEKNFFNNNWEGPRGYSVQQTSDKGYIIGGSTASTYMSDLLLIKTDEEGNEQWNRTFGGEGTDWGYSVIQTLDGDYVFGGVVYNSGKFWLIRIHPDGSTIWEGLYLSLYFPSHVCVQQTLDYGFIATGTRDVNGSGRCFILKLHEFELKNTFIFGRYTNLTEEVGYITIEAINLRLIFSDPFQWIHYIDAEKIIFVKDSAKVVILPRFILGFIKEAI